MKSRITSRIPPSYRRLKIYCRLWPIKPRLPFIAHCSSRHRWHHPTNVDDFIICSSENYTLSLPIFCVFCIGASKVFKVFGASIRQSAVVCPTMVTRKCSNSMGSLHWKWDQLHWESPTQSSKMGLKTDTAKHRASTPLWTLWNVQLFNNAAGKPDWRCFSSSTMASSPLAPAVCQDQQAADVARGRTTTTAMTSPPAGHSTGRCRSSQKLYQTGITCLRRSWRLTPWTASSPGSTPTWNSDPLPLPLPKMSSHRWTTETISTSPPPFWSGRYASTLRPQTVNPSNNVRTFNSLKLDIKWKKKWKKNIQPHRPY